MKHASVFSGIGGPEIAAAMLGWYNLFHCEINPFGCAILDYWFPNSESYEDITKTDFSKWRGQVDVLTGGFPCQPFSYAGQRRGSEDDRYLWPYMFRCIDQIRPAWVVAENVAGILTMVEQGEVSAMESQGTLFDEVDGVPGWRLRETFTMQRICDDLEGHGYEVQPVLIPACAVGAPHRRDRVFIVGHRIDFTSDNTSNGRHGCEREDGEERCSDRNSVGIEEENADWIRFRSEPRIYGAERHATDTSDAGLAKERPEQQTAGTTRSGIRNVEGWNAPDTEGEQSERLQPKQSKVGRAQQEQPRGRGREDGGVAGCGRWESFPTVSPVHRGNDGLPFSLDDLAISSGKWRTESLKAYGNAIVPQVMYEIFRAIEIITEKTQKP